MNATPSDSRRLLGQHFTPEPLVRLVCALGITKPSDRVLDPACGDGAFLRGAAERLRELGRPRPVAGQVCGVETCRWHVSETPHRGVSTPFTCDHQVCGYEIDAAHAEAARTVPGACVRAEDFLAASPEPRFDAIVGNFPFVRQELVQRKRALRELVQAEWLDEFPEVRLLSGRADLYLYFFLHAARFLRDGGRMAVISGNNWLHVPYGATLRRFLLQKMNLQIVLESRAEIWFPHTEANAVVTVAEKGAPATGSVLFVQATAPLEPRADYSSKLPSNWMTRRVPADALAADDDWQCRLRAPAVLHEILARAGDRLVPLSSLAHITRGITTGLNDFFFIEKQAAADLRLEPEFLAPVIASLRGVTRLILGPEHAKHRLLLADKPREQLRGTRVLRHIESFEHSGRLPAHSPTLQSREHWYRLQRPAAGDIAVLRFRRERHFSPANPRGIILGDTVFTATLLDRRHVPHCTASANSTLFHFLAETTGRDNMGGGFITTYGPEIKALRVPAPACLLPVEAELAAAFRGLAARDIATMERELHCDDRRVLDEIIWRALGLPMAMLDDMYGSFERMLVARREFGMLARERR